MRGQRKSGRVSDFDIRNTAHHEAAHAVAAHFHQVTTRKVTIRPEADSLGHNHHAVVIRREIEWDDSDRNRLRAERLALVCLAGPSSTRRFLAVSNRRRSYRHEQHASDYHTAINVLSYFAGGAVLEKYLHYMDARAEAFVESRWWAITAVAQALLQHTTLRGAAVKQVIAEASDAQLHSSQRRRESGELPEYPGPS